MSNTKQSKIRSDIQNKQLNTFYTPSFEDEEFKISSLNQHHIQQPLSNQFEHQMEQSQYQMPQSNESFNMNIMDDQQNQYALWNQDSQQLYVNQNEFQGQTSNQMYFSDPINNQHAQSQQMLMMPPPQKSPQVTSPMNFIGQSPIGYGENGTASDDSDDSGLRANSLKRPSPEPLNDKIGSPNSSKTIKSTAIKKPKVQRKKKKKDPHEPQKPVSAYALFFRDTQAAIKGQHPNASFGEVSTIVASMWDILEPEHKDVYKKKTEAAKIEYLKTLAAYRASVVSKGNDLEVPPHHSPQQQVNNVHATPQSQLSPQQLSQGLPMQQPNPQPNQFIQQQQQQQQQQVHNSYPQYVRTYKSPTQHLDYNTQVSMQSNMQAQQQLQQMGINTMIPTHGTQNQMVYSYDNSQTTENINGIVTMDNNPYMNQQTIAAQHNQNSHQITGVEQNNLPTVGINSSPPNIYNQQNVQQCIRHGCTNQAMVSPDWEDEYCSNECVINHCGDVFGNWIQKNGQQQQTFSAVK